MVVVNGKFWAPDLFPNKLSRQCLARKRCVGLLYVSRYTSAIHSWLTGLNIQKSKSNVEQARYSIGPFVEWYVLQGSSITEIHNSISICNDKDGIKMNWLNLHDYSIKTHVFHTS